MTIAIALHVLAAAIWVGGMFFAYVCLRPATAALDPPLRLQLWERALRKFFPWVWSAVVALLISGFWMFFQGVQGTHVFLMMGLGIAMMLFAAHVYFAPFKKFRRLVAVHNWQDAARQLNQIRQLIAINLSLGLIVLAIASAGRYYH